MQILLIILLIVFILGLIRVMLTPSNDPYDFIMNIFFIDFLFDLIGLIIEAISDL